MPRVLFLLVFGVSSVLPLLSGCAETPDSRQVGEEDCPAIWNEITAAQTWEELWPASDRFWEAGCEPDPAACRALWDDMLAAETDDEAWLASGRFEQGFCHEPPPGLGCNELQAQWNKARSNAAQVVVDNAGSDIGCQAFWVTPEVCADAWRDIVEATSAFDKEVASIVYGSMGCRGITGTPAPTPDMGRLRDECIQEWEQTHPGEEVPELICP